MPPIWLHASQAISTSNGLALPDPEERGTTPRKAVAEGLVVFGENLLIESALSLIPESQTVGAGYADSTGANCNGPVDGSLSLCMSICVSVRLVM